MKSVEKKVKIASEKEKTEFAAGALTTFGEKFKSKEMKSAYLQDFLLEQGINVCQYPENYALSEYVDQVEEIFEEIWWEMQLKKVSMSNKKIAHMKGFILGTLIKSKQVHEDFRDLQDNLLQIESINSAKKIVEEDFYYSTDCTQGYSRGLALAYLNGQLNMAMRHSFTPEDEEDIYKDIEHINESIYAIEQLRDGTHKVYRKD